MVGGDGNTKFSLTARPDIASYLVHALVHFSPSELKNQTLNIEGEAKVKYFNVLLPARD